MNRYRLSWMMTEADSGTLIREFLSIKAAFSNRLLIKAKQTEGEILVNGNRKTVRYVLQPGDVLEVTLPPEKISEYVKKEQIPLHILYEDEDILILNKETGMPTMPSQLHSTGTLANGILYYYKQHQIPYTIHVVTRLDRDTSGIILVAKHQYCHSLLSSMQRQHQIKRVYTAFVHGYLHEKQALIDEPIGRHPHSIVERIVTTKGQSARTHYQVLAERNDFSMLNVQLETGRTHQIRVHFAYIGHPLLGDELYGGKQDRINRQALHCSEISFIHPFSNQEVWIQSTLPKDMYRL